jgi:hypothetical protein
LTAQRIGVCLEDLKARPRAPRYLACVALEHGQPGLGLDESGALVWRDAERTALELFALRDGRLALAVLTESENVQIERAGKTFTIPQAMKGIAGEVAVLDGDLLTFGVSRFRVHVHGPVPQAFAPRAAESPGPPIPARPAPPGAVSKVGKTELDRSRHLARKLLSELARSRAEVVAEGRMRKDLLKRLGPEIEEVRRRWREGLPEALGGRCETIFNQAVLDLIAGGKEETLGE